MAEDNAGTIGRQEIRISLGDVSQSDVATRSDEIHQVILNEGEWFKDDEIRKFPRLECYLFLDEDGRLVLNRGTPGESHGMIWKSAMYKDPQGPHYATWENGQLAIYRGTLGHPEANPFKTPPGPGLCKLAITVSKQLVIFREVAAKKRTVWRSYK